MDIEVLEILVGVAQFVSSSSLPSSESSSLSQSLVAAAKDPRSCHFFRNFTRSLWGLPMYF